MNLTNERLIALTLMTTAAIPFALAVEDGHDHGHGHEEAVAVTAEGSGHDSMDEGDALGGGDDHGDGAETHGGGDDGHGHAEPASDAELNGAQRRAAQIETLVVTRQTLGEAITAPGEAVLNAYRTTKVTPRTAAQVVKRHARLGDYVKVGQPLVTLSSVEMAEAQGALMEAHVELQRAETLGRQVVSEKRFVAARIAYQQAYGKVSAYGMTDAQIETLTKTGDAAKATGDFVLLSLQDGTVISDDFVIGELVEPGRELMTISDESRLWVEARLQPEDAVRVKLNSPARVQAGQQWLDGKVTQVRHTLDEVTRTMALHVEVVNPDHALHPGQFVTVTMESGRQHQGIVAPMEAVLRSADGDWQVFVEAAPGRFEPKEVELLLTVGDRALIDGIAEGTTIVGKGAFFVQSEIAKSGFEVHNH